MTHRLRQAQIHVQDQQVQAADHFQAVQRQRFWDCGS
jgi:hypothetical protein